MNTTMPPKKKRGQDTEDRHKARNMVALHPDLHRQLKKLAERNNRPLSWELRKLIIDHLEQEGLWPPEPEE
jgi:hypothetical protein